MQNTTNYLLKKPELTDYVNVEDLNENADIIDAELKRQDDELVTHKAESATEAHLAKNIGLEDASGNFTATNVEGAINELFTNVSNGKDLVGGAITGVDDSVVIPTDPTFQDLADAIDDISTGLLNEFTAGNTEIYNDSVRVSIFGEYQKVKETKVLLSGRIRVRFDLFASNNSVGNAYGRIFVNGLAVGTERHKIVTAPTTYTEDIDVISGDFVQIYLSGQGSTQARNDLFAISIGLPVLSEKQEV